MDICANYIIFFSFPKGVEIGGDVTKTYFNKAEQYDKHFVHKVGSFIKFIYATFIFQSGLGPIFYIITGAPNPEQWFSKMQMKLASMNFNS